MACCGCGGGVTCSPTSNNPCNCPPSDSTCISLCVAECPQVNRLAGQAKIAGAK
jgi:hypothetical protein